MPPRVRPAPVTGFAAIALLAVGAAVAQAFGRFTYGVLLPAVRDDLGISNTVAGSIATLNVGAYLLGTVAVAVATASRRLLDVLRVGFVFSTAGLVLAAVAPGPALLGLAMVLAGFGGACIWIPTPVIAADALPPARRGLAVGLMGSGIGLGIVFAGQLAGAVRAGGGDAAWRTVYVVQAVVAVVVLAAILAFIGHGQARPAAGRPARGGLGGFPVLRRMAGWLPLTLAYTVFGFMYLLVIAFLTTRLEDDSGWTGERASLAFAVLGVAVVFGGPTFIALGRRIGPRRSLALAFSLWSGAALAVLPGWFEVTLVASALLGLLFGGIPGMITLYVVEHTSIDEYGPSFAAATLAFGVAQMLSPQAGGLLGDLAGSFTPVFVLSSLLAVAGAVASLRLADHPASTSGS